MDRNQAFKHFLFWFMVPAILGPGAFNTAFFFHQVHFAEVKGISHVALVAMFPVYTMLSTGFMMVAGFLIDRFGPVRLITFIQLPMVVGFMVFSIADGTLGLLIGLFFFWHSPQAAWRPSRMRSGPKSMAPAISDQSKRWWQR